jgi:hypothetical protein
MVNHSTGIPDVRQSGFQKGTSMNQRFTAIAAAAIGLSAATAGHSFAQGFGAPQQGQGPPARPGFGAQSMSVPGLVDPMKANPMGLLQRPEVQSEIGLDLRQKHALAALEDKSRTEAQQTSQLRSQALDRRQYQNMTPEQRRARLQELNAQIQSASQPAQGELTPQIKEILKPEQIKRLTQLDWQRRGPLALADAKLAADVPLSAEHRQAIQQIVQSYQQQQGEVVRGAFETMRESARQGQPSRPPDFTSPLSPLRQKLTKVRKASEQQALDTLSPEEKAKWQEAQGDPFTFRTDRA